MIISIPLQPGTLLANVRYKFIIGTTESTEETTGISQPNINFAVFLFDVTLPDGTTELIAYDATDLSNWNVGGLTAFTAAGSDTSPSFVAPIPSYAISALRRTPFKAVVDQVVRLHGLNPRGDIPEDIVFAITEHVNARVEQACLAWDWPEWSMTEQRAFRTPWNADAQFYRANANGIPDEIFYIPNTTYYKVLADAVSNPPIGTLPTDTDYFAVLDPVDSYLEYDQPCKRSIGTVLSIYGTDPRSAACCNGSLLRYKPSEKGVDVCGHGPMVYVHYQMPIPVYTMMPYVAGKVYERGEVVLDPASGECFVAVGITNDAPRTLPALWRHVPFLRKWLQFVKWGAYADGLTEIDAGNSIDANVRAEKSQKAEEKAMIALQQQVDSFAMQGQKLQWNFRRCYDNWCESIPWCGGTVTTLTDACESGLGFVYPDPVSDCGGVKYEYHYEIKSLRGPQLVPLNSLATVCFGIGSIIIIVIDPGTGPERQEYRMVEGPADTNDPGHVQPLDYDATTNSKHWESIG